MALENVDLVIAQLRAGGTDEAYAAPAAPRAESLTKADVAARFWELLEQGRLNSPCDKLYRRDRIVSLFPTDMRCGEDLKFNMDYLTRIQNVCLIDANGYNYFMPEGKVRAERDVYSCMKYAESVRDFLADTLPARQYENRWRVFCYRNICGDVKTIACNKSFGVARELIKEYVEDQRVKPILSSDVQIPARFRIVGWLLRHRMVISVILCMRAVGRRKAHFTGAPEYG